LSIPSIISSAWSTGWKVDAGRQAEQRGAGEPVVIEQDLKSFLHASGQR